MHVISSDTTANDRDLFWVVTYHPRAPYEREARVNVRGYIEAIAKAPDFGRPRPLIFAEFSCAGPTRIAIAEAHKFAAAMIMLEGISLVVNSARVQARVDHPDFATACGALSLGLGIPFRGRF